MPKAKQSAAIAVLILLMAACSSVETDPTYSDKAHDDIYKNGSLMSDSGGFDLFGSGKTKHDESYGLGVNGFLWRAALDTISFMPIQSADPFGGVIITDWYSAPDNPEERAKLNVYIRDRDLRADGIKVSIFRQTRDVKNNWVDAPSSPATAVGLENAILTRARQIRLAQKQFQ